MIIAGEDKYKNTIDHITQLEVKVADLTRKKGVLENDNAELRKTKHKLAEALEKEYEQVEALKEQLKQSKLKAIEEHNSRELYWAGIMMERDKEIEGLKANKGELEEALKLLTELYEKNKAEKGHEYQVSCMVDKSLSFLEKKVDRADMLLKNPHRIFFTKAKKPKEAKI
jgi:DNA repair exonuclease SbcCD ATPase subunit